MIIKKVEKQNIDKLIYQNKKIIDIYKLKHLYMSIAFYEYNERCRTLVVK